MEEISLREYIEVMLKGKRLIAIITVLCMVLGLAVGFVQPKKYEATITLLTNPINKTETSTAKDTLNGVINSISQYPQMDIETYKEQFLNSQVITNTIHDLNLVNKDGKYISIDSLKSKVTVENPEDTNLLKITVKDSDPELSAKVANKLGEYFSQFISELNRAQGTTSSEAIAKQMNIEKEKLDAESKKLGEYNSKNKSIKALSSEIDALIVQLTEYKTSLNNIESTIATDKMALEVLLNGKQSILGIDTGSISVNISDTNTNISEIPKTFSFNMDSANKLQGSLLSIEITNTETRLNSSLAQEKAVSDKIAYMETKLGELQTTYTEQSSEFLEIQRNFDLAQQTYDAYQDKFKEAIITAASDLGRVSIQISTPAIVPENPSGISKALILAISLVLGLMVGIFVVFFKEYWSTSNALDTKKK